jgi:hypothetical protein
MAAYNKRLTDSDARRWDFGPWYDHYIKPFGNCHPNFNTTVIGGEGGVKVCTRKILTEVLSNHQHTPLKSGSIAPSRHYLGTGLVTYHI